MWTGRESVVLRDHDDRVYSAAFSPDGARVVTASDDKTARILDVATGNGIAVLHGHGGRVCCAAFSSDGARVVTASWDNTRNLGLRPKPS
jgi:WD40 repeat protein